MVGAQEAQRIILNAPMAEVEAFLESLRPDVQSGRVVYKRPAYPDPQTTGPTQWMEEPTTADEKEIVQAARRAWANAEDGNILPGLPGGPQLH